MSRLQQMQVDVAFLSETHLRQASVSGLQRGWVSQVFHSKFDARARGVAILINKNIAFQPTEVISDPNGRYIIVTGQIFVNKIILVNVYAPNCDNSTFFRKMFMTIPKIDNGFLILGGDFNLVLNSTLDGSSNVTQNLSRSAKVVTDFMDQCGLSDNW